MNKTTNTQPQPEWRDASAVKPQKDDSVLAHVKDPVSGKMYLTSSIWDGKRWNNKVVYFKGWPVIEWRPM